MYTLGNSVSSVPLMGIYGNLWVFMGYYTEGWIPCNIKIIFL